MEKILRFLLILIFINSPSFGQALLNKIKSKASQEVSQLENKTSAQTSGTALNKNKLSSNVTRTVAVSMGSDEVFDYAENCINLGEFTGQVSFIVTKRVGNSTQCYSYKNGTKTAVSCPVASNQNNGCQTSLQCSYTPLKELESTSDEYKKYITYQTESHNVQQPTISDQQMKMMAAYMTPAQLDEVKKQMAEAQKQPANQTYRTITSGTINFNGKSYGPFKRIDRFYLSADGKVFYTIASESADGIHYQSKMISSGSGTVLTLGQYTSVLSCFASSDNSEFGYVSSELSGQKYLITTSAGKSFQMPLTEGFSGAWFSATGTHVISLSADKLYFDGKMIKTFTSGANPQPCDLFVSSDGQDVTIIKNNTVSFADGDYFEYPLKVAIVTIGGKVYYKWLALENREVVVYQKPY